MRHTGSGPDIDPVVAVDQVEEPVRSRPAVVAVHTAVAAVRIAVAAVRTAEDLRGERHIVVVEEHVHTAAVHNRPEAAVVHHSRLVVRQPCRPSRLWCRS